MSSFKFFAFPLVVFLVLNHYANAKICAGCPVEQDVHNPEIKHYLKSVMSSRNDEGEVVRILSAKTQIVSGVKYMVKFEVEEPRTQEVKVCDTVFLRQPWIQKEPRILEFSCEPVQHQERQLLGTLKDVGKSEMNLISQLADMAVSTLDDIDTDDSKRAVAEIIDAKKQLVNGIMYYLSLRVKTTSCDEYSNVVSNNCLDKEIMPQEICQIQIHRSFADRSPLNAKVVKSECDVMGHEISGAPVQSSVQSELVKEAANFAAKYISEMSNSVYKQVLVRVLEATSQVVSGTKFDLKLELGTTECMKNNHKESNCATVLNNSERNICRVSVWVQPWKKNNGKSHMKVTSFNCGPFYRAKRALVGGVTGLDINDKRVTDLKNFIEDELSSRANSQYTKSIVKILNATIQTVSGTMTKVTLEVADTNCLKTENKAKSDCLPTEQGLQICTLDIWERPWLQSKEITRSECHSTQNNHGNNNRQKRMAYNEILGLHGDEKDVNSFLDFMKREEKVYKNNEEMVRRFRIFKANLKKIATLQKHEQGTAIYGANMFADLTREEFKKYLGYKVNTNMKSKKIRKVAATPNITIPVEFDWRNHNAVTPVKNQGQCGSCWAFSVTGNIEGLWAIENNELISLSEQELVDCDKYDHGCNGGDFDTAYHAIEDLGGLESESDYPYKADVDRCHFNSTDVKVSISDGYNVSNDETDMAKYLVKNGPISIALNANAMQFYMGGVSHPFKFLCNPKSLDHGVLLVGYGIHKTRFTHKNLPYWLIKNSWGKSWGNQGYYMLYRGDGSCGVNQAPTTAIL